MGILPAYARARSAYVSISDADRAPELDAESTIALISTMQHARRLS
jgi:hypothetical protein